MQLILQVHAHGGAVQEPLRQFSLRLREQRRNALKEKVGKLSGRGWKDFAKKRAPEIEKIRAEIKEIS
ncbi:hypothetical protein LWS74_13210, partial [Staphylococcus pasteuri]